MTNAAKSPPAKLFNRLSRRRFVQAAGASALPAWPLADAAATTAIEAYTSQASVRAGATISLHARDPQGSNSLDRSFELVVMRLGAPDVAVWSTSIKLRNRSVPANASTAGCGWPAALTFTVPTVWPSGVYYAVIGSGRSTCAVPFVVRPAAGTAPVAVMVQVAVTTAQAYNNYGGKSLYAYNSSGGKPAVKVSFDRPFAQPWNDAFDFLQTPLLRWLAREGVAAHYCTNVDLHADAQVLSGYRLMVTAGHDEYWSRPMRERLDAHVASGGNAAIFSGNTCWWQARFEPGAGGAANRTLVCYKSASADPDPRAAFKTVNWIDLAPSDPENSSIGLSWKLGASWTSGATRPDTPYVVQRPAHWVFADTGLARGAGFGGAYAGYEIDALALRWALDRRAYPTASDGSPAQTRVLAVADATQWDALARALGQPGEKSGLGVMAVFSRGAAAGTVFNAGSTDWCRGLQPELDGQVPSAIGRITRNVMSRLSSRWVESVEVLQWRTPQADGDGERYYYTALADAPSAALLDGVAFHGHAQAQAGTVPVCRYRYSQANGDGLRYHYSLQADIGYGWVPDGVAFHAYADGAPGLVPIYQFHRAQAYGDGWRFMYGAVATPLAGWELDGVAFHTVAG